MSNNGYPLVKKIGSSRRLMDLFEERKEKDFEIVIELPFNNIKDSIFFQKSLLNLNSHIETRSISSYSIKKREIGNRTPIYSNCLYLGVQNKIMFKNSIPDLFNSYSEIVSFKPLEIIVNDDDYFDLDGDSDYRINPYELLFHKQRRTFYKRLFHKIEILRDIDAL